MLFERGYYILPAELARKEREDVPRADGLPQAVLHYLLVVVSGEVPRRVHVNFEEGIQRYTRLRVSESRVKLA